jgi:hypothetical protein
LKILDQHFGQNLWLNETSIARVAEMSGVDVENFLVLKDVKTGVC